MGLVWSCVVLFCLVCTAERSPFKDSTMVHGWHATAAQGVRNCKLERVPFVQHNSARNCEPGKLGPKVVTLLFSRNGCGKGFRFCLRSDSGNHRPPRGWSGPPGHGARTAACSSSGANTLQVEQEVGVLLAIWVVHEWVIGVLGWLVLGLGREMFIFYQLTLCVAWTDLAKPRVMHGRFDFLFVTSKWQLACRYWAGGTVIQ